MTSGQGTLQRKLWMQVWALTITDDAVGTRELTLYADMGSAFTAANKRLGQPVKWSGSLNHKVWRLGALEYRVDRMDVFK